MTIYAQFCPVAKATEVVAERWTPLVLRELLCGSQRFSEIHSGLPRISPSLLSRRLRQLQLAGLVERRQDDRGPTYHLTAAGEELRPVIEGLGTWGQRWMHEIADDELDPNLLMTDLYRRIDPDRMPDQQVIVRFTFDDAEPHERDWWLVLGPAPESDVCRTDRGFEVDLYLRSTVRAFTEVWMGSVGLNEALRGDRVRLTGPAELQRRLHDWLGLNQFAHVERAEPPLPRMAATGT